MATKTSQSGGLSRLLTIFAIVLGVLAPVVMLLERNLESFYIFKLDELHDLAARGVKAHGNDTNAIVSYIVAELAEKHPKHVNPRHDDPDEWMFNNAGGAMGGMYLIHASKSNVFLSFFLKTLFNLNVSESQFMI
jgi:C-8 sterol isomerase